MDQQQPHISIQEVLSIIRSATDTSRPFRLEVVVSKGRSRGRISVLAQCVKGAPAGASPARAAGAADRPAVLHKEHDTLPIHDLEAGQYKTPLISHIIGFNEFKVIH